ncbi:MAG: hypothetical protein ACLFTG_12890, partial [Alphaproteobacteria bacterium]
ARELAWRLDDSPRVATAGSEPALALPGAGETGATLVAAATRRAELARQEVPPPLLGLVEAAACSDDPMLDAAAEDVDAPLEGRS